jgi:anti-sigma factor RsiW
MTCEEFEELMTAYLEGELPPHKRQIFEEHIGSCKQCQEEMSRYENCTRIFRKFVRDEDPPATLRKAVFERCDCENPSDCCPPPRNDE